MCILGGLLLMAGCDDVPLHGVNHLLGSLESSCSGGCGPLEHLLCANRLALAKLHRWEVKHWHSTMSSLDDVAFCNRIFEALLSTTPDSGNSLNHSWTKNARWCNHLICSIIYPIKQYRTRTYKQIVNIYITIYQTQQLYDTMQQHVTSI